MRSSSQLIHGIIQAQQLMTTHHLPQEQTGKCQSDAAAIIHSCKDLQVEGYSTERSQVLHVMFMGNT